MSDLLIRGMEMPKDCLKCPFCLFADGYWKCLVDGSHADFGGTCRPSLCPLVPVPPHGRLGDLDVLKKIVASAKHMDAHIFNGKTMYSDHLCVGADYDDVCKAIDEVPTIIPASEECK